MTLEFANPSRSFDEEHDVVRCIGHGGVFEVPFFIDADALAPSASKSGGLDAMEIASLAAFDAARRSVYDTVRKLHSRGWQTNCAITAADVR
ncbi:MAG: DUF1488 family protein [Rhizobiaceae bacterium]|nr:MAG: DUF1488 family protein [Rhizobiaceae bacterium]